VKEACLRSYRHLTSKGAPEHSLLFYFPLPFFILPFLPSRAPAVPVASPEIPQSSRFSDALAGNQKRPFRATEFASAPLEVSGKISGKQRLDPISV